MRERTVLIDVLKVMRSDPDPDDLPLDPKYQTAVMRMVCCDCGLTHDIVYLRGRRRLKVYWRRNNHSTGQVRRWSPAKKRRAK
jgi:hypothetical protein